MSHLRAPLLPSQGRNDGDSNLPIKGRRISFEPTARASLDYDEGDGDGPGGGGSDENIFKVLRKLLASVARRAGGVAAAEVWFFPQETRETAELQMRMHTRWEDQDYLLRSKERLGVQKALEGSHFMNECETTTTMGVGIAGVLLQEVLETDGHSFAERGCCWRRLADMAEDPLLPYDLRAKQAAELYLYAGGMALPERSGVMVLFTKVPIIASDARGLADCMKTSCTPLLRKTADTIFNVAEVDTVLNAFLVERCESAKRGWALVRNLFKTGFLAKAVSMRRRRRKASIAVALSKSKHGPGIAQYFRKWLGTSGKPTPSANWSQVAWTWCGCLFSFLTIGMIDFFMKRDSHDEFYVMLAPLGALATLLFAVPNAPLVQPRNIFLGSSIAALVAVGFSYLTSPMHLGLLPQWLTNALAPATTIALMHKTGLVHPPAGAACLLFVNGPAKLQELGWLYIFIPVLSGAMLMMVTSMIFNNLSPKRQFPIYW